MLDTFCILPFLRLEVALYSKECSLDQAVECFWNNSENRASGTCSNVACTNFAAEKLSVGTSFRKFKSKRWQENTAEVRAKDGNTLKVQARGNAPRIASPKKDTKATPHLRMWQHGTMEYTNECQRKQLYAEVCSRRNMMQRTSITNPWL